MSALPPGLDRSMRRLNAWRAAPDAPASERGSYKEWTHFCIRLPGESPGHLLVNMSVTERALPAAVVRTPRLMALVHAGAWEGFVDSFDATRVRGCRGGLDLVFGDSSLRWRGDRFELCLRGDSLDADLELRPLVLPTGTSSVSFGPGHAMHWVAVPRLLADGVVEVRGTRLGLEGAAAYHDHNWGDFRWGADLSWEWGFLHPRDLSCPWSVVFVRVSDGLRHRTLNQGVLLWKDGVLARTFLNHEVRVRLEGVHVGPRPLTLPGVLGLLLPGAASGVPASLHLDARGLDDELEVTVTTQSRARIAMPSDVDPFRTVLLNETAGVGRVRGRTRHGEFDFDGFAIVEYVRG